MKLQVSHTTSYSFDPPVASLVQSLRLWPTDYAGQSVATWSVTVEDSAYERGAGFRDGAGDWVETVSMRQVGRATIRVEGEVEIRDLSGVVRGLREKVPPTAYLRPSPMTRLDAGLRALAAEACTGVESDLDRAHCLAQSVARAIAYESGTTASGTTAAEALAQGRGVCQDQAHALIAVGRAMGMPGRYVVGYLHSGADGAAHQASHAWAELWVAGLGWVGFDAANGCCPDDRYIRLGSGLDAVAAAPIRGSVSSASEERLDVEVRIREEGQQ